MDENKNKLKTSTESISKEKASLAHYKLKKKKLNNFTQANRI